MDFIKRLLLWMFPSLRLFRWLLLLLRDFIRTVLLVWPLFSWEQSSAGVVVRVVSCVRLGGTSSTASEFSLIFCFGVELSRSCSGFILCNSAVCSAITSWENKCWGECKRSSLSEMGFPWVLENLREKAHKRKVMSGLDQCWRHSRDWRMAPQTGQGLVSSSLGNEKRVD